MHTRTRSSFSVPFPFAFSFLFPSSNNAFLLCFFFWDYSSIYNNQDLEQEEENKHMHQMYIVPVSIFLHIILSIYIINQAQNGRSFSHDAEACDHCIGSVASICICSRTDPVKAHKASAPLHMTANHANAKQLLDIINTSVYTWNVYGSILGKINCIVFLSTRDVYPFSIQADDADYELICSSCLFSFNFSQTAS